MKRKKRGDNLAGRKEYELLFKLRAALGADFSKSFQSAIKTTKQLQGTLKQLNSTQGKIESYQRQSTAIDKNRAKLEELNNEHNKLQQEMRQSEQPSEELSKKFKKNASQITETTARIQEQEKRLAELRNELKSAGINTDNLEEANKRLEKSYNSVKKSQENLAKINVAQQKNREIISETKGELLKTVGVVGAVAAAIYAGPVKSSMEFQSAMADVVKVVNGLKDEKTGKLTKEYYNMKKEILDLSTKIPMTAKELTEIAAAAGQAGIARKEITQFSVDAGKMGIAFDTTAEQAGEWMAKWRTSFGLTQKQVVELSDKINYLGNTSPANAQQISSIVTKIGPIGEVAGFANGEIAALGATLVSVGVNEDVAATGIKKMMTTMTAGSAATKRQKGVLDKLGISATDLANRMQKDAKGAVLDFMKAVNKLPEAERAATLKNYFGEESVAAIAPMLTKLDLLQEQFKKVGDASLYAGSMEAEYAARADTTENKVQLAKNSLAKLSIVLGDTFLPYVGEAAEKLSELVTKFADFAAKNPQLVKTIAKVVTGFAAFKIASLGIKLGFHEIRGGALEVQRIFELFRGKVRVASSESVGLGTKLSRAGDGMKSYFGSLRGAFGGLFGGNVGSKITMVTDSLKGKMFNVFSLIGGRAANIFTGAGKAITNGPLGKIGTIIGGQLGKTKTFLAPLTKVITTAFSPLKGILGNIFGGFGGLIGKVLPFVGVITAIIAAVQLFKSNLQEIRGLVERIFGEAGLAVFDKFIATVSKIGAAIKGVFSGEGIQNIRDFINNTFGDNPALAKFLNGFITVFGAIGNVLGEFISFVGNNITPIIQNIFDFIVGTVLPVIAQKFSEWAPTIASIIEGLWLVIQKVASLIVAIVNFIGPTVKEVIITVLNTIIGIIGGALKVIKGIVDIFAGVFTGDWKRVWNGVKSIFAGVWEAMKSIIKAPLNFIISGVNTLIRGLNKLKIPSWVPKLGGKGINIPEIPAFENGTKRTPDTFIAGEHGAELVTNAKNRSVFTAAQTKEIFDNIPRIQDLFTLRPKYQLSYETAGTAQTIAEPAKVRTIDRSSGTTVTIQNQPTIIIDGKAPEDLDRKLKENNQNLLNEVEERLRKKEDDERRGRYE